MNTVTTFTTATWSLKAHGGTDPVMNTAFQAGFETTFIVTLVLLGCIAGFIVLRQAIRASGF